MARFLKNPDLANGAQAAKLPIVPSDAYGDAPIDGLIRFNQNTKRIQFYYNNAWNEVAKIGTLQLITDTFPGDGITINFTMSQAETDPRNIAVFVGGVYQIPTTHYTVSGVGIQFVTAPPAYTSNSPTQIIVIHNINSTNVPA